MRADEVLHAVSRHFVLDHVFLTEVTVGQFDNAAKGHTLRMDGLAIKRTYAAPCLAGIEVKVDHKDFVRDEKWPGYLPYCHKFYFACPTGLIKPEELTADVGLIYCDPETKGTSIKRRAKYRAIDMPWQLFFYLTLRNGSERHPFFSSRREELEAWVRDKEERQFLALSVYNKLTDQLRRAIRRAEDAERKAEGTAHAAANWHEFTRFMREQGYDDLSWRQSWQDVLAEALRGHTPERLVRAAQQIINDAETLINMIGDSKTKEGQAS